MASQTNLLLRHLIKACLSEAVFQTKYFADSTQPTGNQRPRLYAQWASAGMPDDVEDSDYSSFIEEFKLQENPYEVVPTKEGNPIVMWIIKDDSLEITNINSGPIELMTFSAEEAKKNAAQLKGLYKKGDGIPFPGGSYFVSIKSEGITGFVSLTNLHHNLSGVKNGKLSDQVLGQAIEYAAAYALAGNSKESAIKAAQSDKRYKTTLLNAPKDQQARFDDIIGAAYEQTVAQKEKLNTTDAYVNNDSAVSLVDVPAETPDGPIDIHVKFNDDRRLFGLQSKIKMMDNEEVIIGSKATYLYRKIRDQLIYDLVPTVETYKSWYKANHQNEDPDLDTLIPALSKGRLTDLGPTALPITKENSNGDFIDPRSLTRGLHGNKKEQLITSGIDSLMRKMGKKEFEDNFAPLLKPLQEDFIQSLSPLEPSNHQGVYYFNYSGGSKNGNDIKLKVTQFKFSKDLDLKIEFAEIPKLSRTFNVIMTYAGRKFNPFFVEITSIARGHPLQVHKTSKANPPVAGTGTLQELLDSQTMSESLENLRKLIKEIL